MDKGRSISLDKVRADGWFERLAEDSPNFRRLCDEVGERVVAFSIIAGVRIVSLALNDANKSQSLVEFVVGDEEDTKQLTLGEFQSRVTSALLERGLEGSEESEDDGSELSADAPEPLQERIGFRYVLLAALYGMRLEALLVTPGKPLQIQFTQGEVEKTLLLEQFRDRIHERIRAENVRRQPAPFSLDLSLVEQAQRAIDDKEYDKVFSLLGAWPGPLSLLLRSAEASRLAPEVRSAFARGLGILGTAYAKNEQFDWAQEVIRLGIQWGQDSPAASELFRRLGEACVDRERYGEAIGLLRRSMAIGEPRDRIVPHLAVCYADRKRWVAAILCAEEGLAAMTGGSGDDRERLVNIVEGAREQLGEAWLRFREAFPLSGDETQDPSTEPVAASQGAGEETGPTKGALADGDGDPGDGDPGDGDPGDGDPGDGDPGDSDPGDSDPGDSDGGDGDGDEDVEPRD